MRCPNAAPWSDGGRGGAGEFAEAGRLGADEEHPAQASRTSAWIRARIFRGKLRGLGRL
jgi:hypothetical protein